MASPRGRANDPVVELLLEEGYRFDFFQAVRLLEMARPDRSPLGTDAHPAREVARLRPTLSFNFPSSTLYEVEDHRGEDDTPPFTLCVQFMGLCGIKGVLPWHYTHTLIDQEHLKQHALRDFPDIFNHRLLSFFYRAWLKYRIPLQYREGGTDRPSTYFRAFLGLGTRGLATRAQIPDTRVLAYAGLFAQARSATALQTLLADFLEAPVRVLQFDGEWVHITPADQNRLGLHRGRNGGLGQSLVVGRKIWSRQHKFRIIVGPIAPARFLSLLPDTEGFAQLVSLTRLYVGTSYSFAVQLELAPGESVPTRLGGRTTRLGWTSWLGTGAKKTGTPTAVFPGELPSNDNQK